LDIWELGKVKGLLESAAGIWTWKWRRRQYSALEPTGLAEKVGLTIVADRVRQLHEGLATRFCEANSRGGERIARTIDLQLGEAQSRLDLQ